jgi:hypothetical protein
MGRANLPCRCLGLRKWGPGWTGCCRGQGHLERNRPRLQNQSCGEGLPERSLSFLACCLSKGLKLVQARHARMEWRATPNALRRFPHLWIFEGGR